MKLGANESRINSDRKIGTSLRIKEYDKGMVRGADGRYLPDYGVHRGL